MKKCKNCVHYELLQMIKQGAYGYVGDIPCLRCKWCAESSDEFEPKSLQELQRRGLK